ncbi:hypothetical protein Tco_0097224 [Tanacetum coccineum]
MTSAIGVGSSGGGGGDAIPHGIHVWIERFTKLKPLAFRSAATPAEAEDWITHMEKLEGDVLRILVLGLTFERSFYNRYFSGFWNEVYEREFWDDMSAGSERILGAVHRSGFTRFASFVGATAGDAQRQSDIHTGNSNKAGIEKEWDKMTAEGQGSEEVNETLPPPHLCAICDGCPKGSREAEMPVVFCWTTSYYSDGFLLRLVIRLDKTSGFSRVTFLDFSGLESLNFGIELSPRAGNLSQRIHFVWHRIRIEGVKEQFYRELENGLFVPVFRLGCTGLICYEEGWEQRALCIDLPVNYRITFRNRLSLPRIDDLFDQLQGAKYFSKIDLRSGYHQLRVNERAGLVLRLLFVRVMSIEFLVIPFDSLDRRSVCEVFDVRVSGYIKSFHLVILYCRWHSLWIHQRLRLSPTWHETPDSLMRKGEKFVWHGMRRKDGVLKELKRSIGVSAPILLFHQVPGGVFSDISECTRRKRRWCEAMCTSSGGIGVIRDRVLPHVQIITKLKGRRIGYVFPNDQALRREGVVVVTARWRFYVRTGMRFPDFVTGLPTPKKDDAICVEIVRLHEAWGTRLKFSTAFHLKPDGQSERIHSDFGDRLVAVLLEWTGSGAEYLCLVECSLQNSLASLASRVRTSRAVVMGGKWSAPICWDDRSRICGRLVFSSHQRELTVLGSRARLSPSILPVRLDFWKRIGEVSCRLGASPLQLSHVDDVISCCYLSLSEEPECHFWIRQERVMRNRNVIPVVKILWKNHPRRAATLGDRKSLCELVMLSLLCGVRVDVMTLRICIFGGLMYGLQSTFHILELAKLMVYDMIGFCWLQCVSPEYSPWRDLDTIDSLSQIPTPSRGACTWIEKPEKLDRDASSSPKSRYLQETTLEERDLPKKSLSVQPEGFEDRLILTLFMSEGKASLWAKVGTKGVVRLWTLMSEYTDGGSIDLYEDSHGDCQSERSSNSQFRGMVGSPNVPYRQCGSWDSQGFKKKYVGKCSVSWRIDWLAGHQREQEATAISTKRVNTLHVWCSVLTSLEGDHSSTRYGFDCAIKFLSLSIENGSLFEGESEFEKLKIYLITLVSIRSDWEDLPWLFRSVENLNTMAELNVPAQAPTRTDEQIVPRSQWLQIGKSNLLFDAQKIQKNPIFQISVDILRNTNFFRAFSASASVPVVYIQ